MHEIFLDTETTGLSPNDSHRIVEIACIETKELIPTKKIFHKIINPQRDVPDDAFKIHGFSTEFLKNKETFDKVAFEFLEFIKDKKIIIHNASFDLSFLNYELKLIRRNEIRKENIIDSLEIARNKFPGTSNSLDALCRRFNISLSRRDKHNALLDCELLREVYINLLDAKEPKLIFSNDNVDINLKNKNNIKQDYCKIIVQPTEKELKLHKEFLKKELKKNYY
ncbi:MAG: DNA polymerase III subunit epsilon [Proteobacteria bacterium]|jgi:DNA polymerase III subunit epsilon|nr:DNA polymerase III subunit epsilon [Pseudomonadota bacterium]